MPPKNFVVTACLSRGSFEPVVRIETRTCCRGDRAANQVQDFRAFGVAMANEAYRLCLYLIPGTSASMVLANFILRLGRPSRLHYSNDTRMVPHSLRFPPPTIMATAISLGKTKPLPTNTASDTKYHKSLSLLVWGTP